MKEISNPKARRGRHGLVHSSNVFAYFRELCNQEIMH